VTANNKNNRRLSEELTRLYFLGWAGISPLVLIAGLIGFVSYDFALSALLAGLWAGILNLGILWSGIFLLIVVGRVFVAFTLRVIGPAEQRPERIRRTWFREFGEAWALGWTILLVTGFIAEFSAHTFHDSGGVFVILAYGVLPMTLAAALLAIFRHN
jgi:hypothetical protein